VLKRLRAIRKNESGFTLTELLIVIVILGILTGVVIVAVGAFDDRGQEAACKSDKKSTEVAVEAYRAKTGAYPNAGSSTARFALLTGGGYLRQPPQTGAGYTIEIQDNAGTVVASGACT
jgi:prepilin-type N-terminal cleavage/methylation domain-containing protein